MKEGVPELCEGGVVLSEPGTVVTGFPLADFDSWGNPAAIALGSDKSTPLAEAAAMPPS
jgi:hypothetical protein